MSTGGKKGKKGKGKGKPHGPFWTDADDWQGQDDSSWLDAWYADDEYAYYDDETYATSDGKGKSKSKGKGKDVCHICGKAGHWKNECPQRSAMYAEPPEDSPPSSIHQNHARGVHFASAPSQGITHPSISTTAHALPGSVYVTQECEQLIELGEELPGEEVAEPFYMAITDNTEQHKSTPGEDEPWRTDEDDVTDTDGEYITVQGTLQVEGRLKI
eukprot:4573641-Amphidinium_carterae.1